ncbi:hypothetical protein MTO96_032570 [Rhipicephalus appendiculatus]
MECPGEGGPPTPPTSAVTIDTLLTSNDRRKVISVRGQKCNVIGALSKTDFRSALEGGRIENAYPSLDLKGQKPHGAGEVSAHSEDFAADVLGTIAGIAARIHVYYAFDVQYAP